MKVVFIARHFTYFRNFESVITALAEQGHMVHLAADKKEKKIGLCVVASVGVEDLLG